MRNIWGHKMKFKAAEIKGKTVEEIEKRLKNV
jgi:ribosomal protein L29